MKNIVFICLGLFFFTSCIKDKPSQPKPLVLPPETQTGKNTFGCLVNGEVWLPAYPTNFSGVYALKTDYGNGYFYIRAVNSDGSYSGSINIHVFNMRAIGSYVLERQINNENYANFTKLSKNCDAYTDTSHLGLVYISRIDTINGIISGRFNFTVESNECGKLKVTDGRFDLKL